MRRLRLRRLRMQYATYAIRYVCNTRTRMRRLRMRRLRMQYATYAIREHVRVGYVCNTPYASVLFHLSHTLTYAYVCCVRLTIRMRRLCMQYALRLCPLSSFIYADVC